MQFADVMDVMDQGRKELRIISEFLDRVAGLTVLPQLKEARLKEG